MKTSLHQTVAKVAAGLMAFIPAVEALADCPTCQPPYLSCHRNTGVLGNCTSDNDGSGECHMEFYYDCYATCPPYDYCFSSWERDYSQPCYC